MRRIGAILLLLWGLYAAVYVGLRLRFSDLTNPGRLGEITGGSICTLFLLGEGIVLLLPRRRSDVAPSSAPTHRERPPGQPDGPSSGDASDTGAEPGAESDQRGI
jgi:hypothetical protein